MELQPEVMASVGLGTKNRVQSLDREIVLSDRSQKECIFACGVDLMLDPAVNVH